MNQKLRILLVNKFYYPRGGDCISMINLEALLRRMGYEVAVYAMAYPKNMPSETARYFASEVSFSGGLLEKLKAANRLLVRAILYARFNESSTIFVPTLFTSITFTPIFRPLWSSWLTRWGVVWCGLCTTINCCALRITVYATVKSVKPALPT